MTSDLIEFYMFKGSSSADWEITNARKPISEGIVVVAYGVPPEGINLLYKYSDKDSVNYGADHFT